MVGSTATDGTCSELSRDDDQADIVDSDEVF
jgi:hypothetical protein